MTVYIDYLFIQSVVFDLVIIVQTSTFSKEKIKIHRVALAVFLSGIYTCIVVIAKLEILNYFWCKIVLSFVIVYVAFIPKTILKYLKLVALFYLSSILTVGATTFVSEILCEGEYQDGILKIIVYVVALLVTYISTNKFWQIYKYNLNKEKLNMNVEIFLNGKKYEYLGFMDTGNTVFSYELGVPIVFAEYLSDKQKRDIAKEAFSTVIVSTITRKSDEKAILVNGLVEGKRVKMGVVFVDNKLNRNGEYNMVLNYKMFEEKLGGISL